MYILDNYIINKMIKNRLDNYLITPPKNGCLTHVDLKLYTKCPHWAKIGLCL